MRALLVEDDYREAHEIAERLRGLLPAINLDTYIVHSLRDALKQLGAATYDVLIVDLVLSSQRTDETDPRVSGVALLRELRGHAPETKIIAYTTFADLSSNAGFLRDVVGADFLFKKPALAEIFGEGLARTLRDFLPADASLSGGPDPSLVVPVRQTVIRVNGRLADIFRRNPEMLRTLDPTRFEELVGELFEEDGYQVVLTPPRADGGKDLYVFKVDNRVETSFLVECKRYVPPNKVGVEIVRQLYGVVAHERVSGGVVVTTSYFTRGAHEFVETVPYHLFLRDFDDLKRWLETPEA